MAIYSWPYLEPAKSFKSIHSEKWNNLHRKVSTQLNMISFLIQCRMGTIEMVIEFPADQVTSVAWGGENLDELYVTTAAQPKTGPQSAEAGHLFRVGGLGVKGTPVFKARVY